MTDKMEIDAAEGTQHVYRDNGTIFTVVVCRTSAKAIAGRERRRQRLAERRQSEAGRKARFDAWEAEDRAAWEAARAAQQDLHKRRAAGVAHAWEMIKDQPFT